VDLCWFWLKSSGERESLRKVLHWEGLWIGEDADEMRCCRELEVGIGRAFSPLLFRGVNPGLCPGLV
jgi:hypothetical protein